MKEDITSYIDPIRMYNEQGFAVLKLFSSKDVSILETFAKNFVYRLLEKRIKVSEKEYPLKTYHTWWNTLGVNHEDLFRASNRYTKAKSKIKNILVNSELKNFMSGIGVQHFELWDEGLGWLGFRFIRPGCGDGYPVSRKEWGPAKNVISLWVPVIGYSDRETLALVPGSHLREYKKYLPNNTKFRKDEYRLINQMEDIELYRPSLVKGQAIVYHPRILHMEDVEKSNVTRLNLEVRINPFGN